MNMLPLCRFCGERHPLLKCPEFDAVEQAHVLIREAKTEIAIGMAQVEGSVILPELGDIAGTKWTSAPIAEITGDDVNRPDEITGAVTNLDVELAVTTAAATAPAQATEHNLEHPVPLVEHTVPKTKAGRKPRARCCGGKPHRYVVQPHSERNLEPWKALGISRRTFYRRKKDTAKNFSRRETNSREL